MSEKILTNDELLAMDPYTLSDSDFNRWEVLNKRASKMNKIANNSLKEQVDYEELKARLSKARCEARTAMVGTMKASIEAMEIHEQYEKAEAFHLEQVAKTTKQAQTIEEGS